MKAYEIMNDEPLFLHAYLTISEATSRMFKKGINAVLLIDEQAQVIGIITKDLLLEVLSQGISPDSALGSLSWSTLDMVDYNAELQFPENARSALIVTKNGHVSGIIDWADVSSTLARQERERKAELEAAIDAVATPIVVVDKDKRITLLSRQAAKVLGIGSREALGQELQEIIHDEMIVDLLSRPELLSGGKINLGSRSFVPFSKNVIKDQEIIGRVLVLRDISELEQVLQESEIIKDFNRELEAIIESSFDGLYVTDGEANTLRLNQGFERIMGITKEQCVGRNMADLVEEGVFSRSGTLAALEKGDRVTLDLVASTGKEALVTSTPIRDQEGRIIRVVTNVRDMTELNQLQRKLDQVQGLREREMEAVIESSFDGLYVTDGEANTLRLNQGFERIMGVTAAECVGRNMEELVERGIFSGSGTLLALDKKEPVTITLISKTGKEALVTSNPIFDEEGNVIMVVTNVRDITELNDLQRKLEHMEGLREWEMEAVIESSFDGLYVTDGEANTLRLNQGFERIMGVSAGECVGRNMRELVERGVFSRSGTLLALERREPVTITLVSKTGKEALVTSNPIFDQDGKVLMVVTNVRDITELNDLQRRLEHMEGLREWYETELQQLKLESSQQLVINSAKMKEVVNLVLRVAQVDSTVLINGESGVGKELIAGIIHTNSNRKDGPFIKVNCGAIPDNLLESELFGYEAGAFTGANRKGKIGYFELAEGGVLFLDEIGELPLNLQVKLLRALQDREIVRVGGVQPIKVDIRILAGTNRNLMEMVEKKQFRLDLFYRLNVIPIYVPPLRERKEDIPVLVKYFLSNLNAKYQMDKHVDQRVIDRFMDYSWPGNVRELENLVERLAITSINDVVTLRDLPFNMVTGSFEEKEPSSILPLKQALEKTERALLETAYHRYHSTYQVAKVLEVNQSTIVRKAAKYGLKFEH